MGVSGLAVLLAISHKKQEELAHLDIYCFDDSDHFGRGIPFQKDDKSALINSPIDDISFDYRHMADFKEWLQKNGHDTQVSYVSRSLYGKYMSERAKTLISKLPVTIIKKRVEEVVYLPKSHTWQLKIEGQSFSQNFDELHLACGELPVSDPYHLEARPNYISDPYPIQNLAKESWAKKTVGVIGTGLAAVDVIKWLLLNTEATIMAFSRSNFFPTVRIIDGPAIDWQFFTDKKLEEALRRDKQRFDMSSFEALFFGELQALGFSDWKKTRKQFLAPGIKGISLSLEYSRQVYFLQQLASRVTEWFTDLWPLMTLSDRQAYQKRYSKAIVNLRNPMPAESAHIILEAASNKRLTDVEGVSDIIGLKKGFSLKRKKDSDISLDSVINATGYHLKQDNLAKASPIIQSLIDQALCQIDIQGGFTVLVESSQVISPRYGVLPNLYAHGALINGVIYQNNSTIKIQKMAERAFCPRT
ncbi:FAD/NAD(P)-binding protein [Streptococcus didelphis]|nr:FAD/NAD(P)-binding protein [Streptococcus didelphis]WMB30145.1 FAD/NAD(P)-binding protein [Streptococcus didelphis]